MRKTCLILFVLLAAVCAPLAEAEDLVFAAKLRPSQSAHLGARKLIVQLSVLNKGIYGQPRYVVSGNILGTSLIPSKAWQLTELFKFSQELSLDIRSESLKLRLEDSRSEIVLQRSGNSWVMSDCTFYEQNNRSGLWESQTLASTQFKKGESALYNITGYKKLKTQPVAVEIRQDVSDELRKTNDLFRKQELEDLAKKPTLQVLSLDTYQYRDTSKILLQVISDNDRRRIGSTSMNRDYTPFVTTRSKYFQGPRNQGELVLMFERNSKTDTYVLRRGEAHVTRNDSTRVLRYSQSAVRPSLTCAENLSKLPKDS